jgi:hypothetical protein
MSTPNVREPLTYCAFLLGNKTISEAYILFLHFLSSSSRLDLLQSGFPIRERRGESKGERKGEERRKGRSDMQREEGERR